MPWLILVLFLALPVTLFCHNLSRIVRRTSSPLCYSDCNFHFCDGSGEYIMGYPNVVGPQMICHRTLDIGNVDRGERQAYVYRDDELIPMRKWNTDTLTLGLAVSEFNFDYHRLEERSGLRHFPNIGNQFQTLDGECIVVPIRRFQYASRGRIQIKTTNDDSDCIAFRTLFADISIELWWNSQSDLELIVEEPNGFEVTRDTPSSACGKRIEENATPDCSATRGFFAAHHRVIYHRLCEDFQEGVYKLKLRQRSSCKPRTKFFLAVSVGVKRRKQVVQFVESVGDIVDVATIMLQKD